MAHVATRFDAGFGHKIAEAVQSFVASVVTAMSVNRDHENRMLQIRKLQSLSDAELAKLGLTRDGIVKHVFRELYYV